MYGTTYHHAGDYNTDRGPTTAKTSDNDIGKQMQNNFREKRTHDRNMFSVSCAWMSFCLGITKFGGTGTVCFACAEKLS